MSEREAAGAQGVDCTAALLQVYGHDVLPFPEGIDDLNPKQCHGRCRRGG